MRTTATSGMVPGINSPHDMFSPNYYNPSAVTNEVAEEAHQTAAQVQVSCRLLRMWLVGAHFAVTPN